MTLSPRDVLSEAEHIAHLTQELARANERARVAEEQLQRVYVAVRDFKARQLRARQAAESAGRASAVRESVDRSGLYSSWGAQDPGLDDRLTEFLERDFEPDKARDWMLGK